MDPNLVSVYISQHGQRFRIGFGTLQTIKAGAFTVDAGEVTRLEAADAEAKAAADKAQAEADAAVAEAERQRLLVADVPADAAGGV